MSGDPLAHWPDRTAVHDDDGRLVLVMTPTEDAHSGRTWLDGVWRPDDVPAPDAAAFVTETFPGSAVSTSDRALVAALLSSGSAEVRHAHSLSHDLAGLPEQRSAPGVRIQGVGADRLHTLADPVGRLLHAAYPPEHPDHKHATLAGAVAAVHRAAEGEVLGPLLDSTTIAWHQDAVVGACLVVEREGAPPDGGPWVLDIFRDPASPIVGLGRALLSEALRRVEAAGLPGLSLVVSHDNTRAHELYRRLGFRDVHESWTLALRDS